MASNPFNRSYNQAPKQQPVNAGYNVKSQPNDLMSFIQKYGNNPQLAQQEVMQMMNSGQLTQEMINNASPQVMQLMQNFGLG